MPCGQRKRWDIPDELLIILQNFTYTSKHGIGFQESPAVRLSAVRRGADNLCVRCRYHTKDEAGESQYSDSDRCACPNRRDGEIIVVAFSSLPSLFRDLAKHGAAAIVLSLSCSPVWQIFIRATKRKQLRRAIIVHHDGNQLDQASQVTCRPCASTGMALAMRDPTSWLAGAQCMTPGFFTAQVWGLKTRCQQVTAQRHF